MQTPLQDRCLPPLCLAYALELKPRTNFRSVHPLPQISRTAPGFQTPSGTATSRPRRLAPDLLRHTVRSHPHTALRLWNSNLAKCTNTAVHSQRYSNLHFMAPRKTFIVGVGMTAFTKPRGEIDCTRASTVSRRLPLTTSCRSRACGGSGNQGALHAGALPHIRSPAANAEACRRCWMQALTTTRCSKPMLATAMVYGIKSIVRLFLTDSVIAGLDVRSTRVVLARHDPDSHHQRACSTAGISKDVYSNAGEQQLQHRQHGAVPRTTNGRGGT